MKRKCPLKAHCLGVTSIAETVVVTTKQQSGKERVKTTLKISNSTNAYVNTNVRWDEKLVMINSEMCVKCTITLSRPRKSVYFHVSPLDREIIIIGAF